MEAALDLYSRWGAAVTLARCGLACQEVTGVRAAGCRFPHLEVQFPEVESPT